MGGIRAFGILIAIICAMIAWERISQRLGLCSMYTGITRVKQEGIGVSDYSISNAEVTTNEHPLPVVEARGRSSYSSRARR